MLLPFSLLAGKPKWQAIATIKLAAHSLAKARQDWQRAPYVPGVQVNLYVEALAAGDAILVIELGRWRRRFQDIVQTLDNLHGWKASVLAQTGLSFAPGGINREFPASHPGIRRPSKTSSSSMDLAVLALQRCDCWAVGHRWGESVVQRYPF
jgi:hypothetical protein